MKRSRACSNTARSGAQSTRTRSRTPSVTRACRFSFVAGLALSCGIRSVTPKSSRNFSQNASSRSRVPHQGELAEVLLRPLDRGGQVLRLVGGAAERANDLRAEVPGLIRVQERLEIAVELPPPVRPVAAIEVAAQPAIHGIAQHGDELEPVPALLKPRFAEREVPRDEPRTLLHQVVERKIASRVFLGSSPRRRVTPRAAGGLKRMRSHCG